MLDEFLAILQGETIMNYQEIEESIGTLSIYLVSDEVNKDRG
jgi:hypothetical protein